MRPLEEYDVPALVEWLAYVKVDKLGNRIEMSLTLAAVVGVSGMWNSESCVLDVDDEAGLLDGGPDLLAGPGGAGFDRSPDLGNRVDDVRDFGR